MMEYKDKLKHIWDVQLDFNKKFYKSKIGKDMNDMTMEEKVFWSKNQLLSIVKESMEVLDEIPNWKEHRNIATEFIPSNLFEEIIDVNKFSLGLAQIWGMTFEDYYKEYLRKSWVVDQRWTQEHDLKSINEDDKIVGIDIDGILGDYPKWFLKFVYEKTGKEFNTLEQVKNCFGTSEYEGLKSLYRQSGWKATMPVCEHASEFTNLLHNKGYKIIILTARPYKDYYTIYPDTLQFLKENEIYFDAIIWDEEKHLRIIKEFPKMLFMIDDTLEVAEAVAAEGYVVFLKQTEPFVNIDPKFWDKIITFSDLLEIPEKWNI
ncbi:MAG: hypothetical protein K0Q47_128 [Sedimentibacter sp.]|nr:hypothetical protein [Sedimentibacter sp.]